MQFKAFDHQEGPDYFVRVMEDPLANLPNKEQELSFNSPAFVPAQSYINEVESEP
jgi:hypothetical protein